MQLTDMTGNVKALVKNLLSKLTKQLPKPQPIPSTIQLFSMRFEEQSQGDSHFPCISEFAATRWLFCQCSTDVAILLYGNGGYNP